MYYRFLFLLLFSFSLIGCRQTKQEIVFRGNITHYSNHKWLYISELTLDGFTLFDSTEIKNGEFNFTLKSTDEISRQRRSTPTFFQLSLQPNQAFTTLAKNGEVLEIEADARNMAKSYNIKGAEDARLMHRLDKQLALFIDSTDILTSIYQSEIENDSVRGLVEKAYNQLVYNHTTFLKDFIAENPTSIATIAAFYQRYNRKIFFIEDENLPLLEQIYQQLVIIYPDNENIKWINNRIEMIKFKLAQENENK